MVFYTAFISSILPRIYLSELGDEAEIKLSILLYTDETLLANSMGLEIEILI